MAIENPILSHVFPYTLGFFLPSGSACSLIPFLPLHPLSHWLEADELERAKSPLNIQSCFALWFHAMFPLYACFQPARFRGPFCQRPAGIGEPVFPGR